MSFALTQKKGVDCMSAFDLIWNLVMMLIDKIEDSKKEEKTKDDNN